MHRMRMKRKERLLTRYLVSYLLISLIPILIFGTIYYKTVLSTIKTEVEKEHLDVASQVLGKLDYTINEFNTISLHFSNYINTDTIDIDFRNKALIPSAITTLVKNYEENIGLPAEMLVYLRGDNNIYLKSGYYSYSQFEGEREQDLTMGQFFSTLVSTNWVRSLGLSPLSVLDERRSTAAFFYPIPFLSAIPLSTMVFFISSSTLGSLYATYAGDSHASVFLVNSEGTIILSNSTKDDSLSSANLRDLKGSGLFRLESYPNTVIIRMVSSSSGYSLIVTMDEATFYQRAHSVRNVYLVSVTSILLLGIILSILVARKLYQPIGQLLDRIHTKQETVMQRDGFEQISQYWDELDEQNNELMITLNHVQPTMEANCVRKLLYGRLQPLEALEFDLKCANIHLGLQSNTVFVLASSKRDVFDEQSSHILEACMEFRSEHARFYATNLIKQSYIALIFAESDASQESRTSLIELGNQVVDHVKSVIDCPIHIGIGSSYPGYEGVAASFAEACVAVEQGFFTVERKVIMFEDLRQQKQNNDREIPTIDHALFIQGLKQANSKLTLQALHNMTQQIQESAEAYHIVQYLCFDILNLLVRTAKNANVDVSQELLKQVCEFTSLPSFEDAMVIVVTNICDQMDDARQKEESQMRTNILDYINNNFTNSQLSLVSIADEFSLTPNFLSRYFKQETGYAYQQYLTMLRMDRIKEMLVTTKLPIKEIILSTGYADIANFMRKFKSLEGLTPGQYREQYSA